MENLPFVLEKWKARPELIEFVNYFEHQWLAPPFKKWQIFHSSPGFASTNNPIESFNKQIKKHFTGYLNFPIYKFISILVENVVPYFSTNQLEPAHRKRRVGKALSMD